MGHETTSPSLSNRIFLPLNHLAHATYSLFSIMGLATVPEHRPWCCRERLA